MDSVSLGCIVSILERHTLKPGLSEASVPISKVEAVLSDIFYVARKGLSSDGPSPVHLTVNLLSAIYDV